MHDDYSVVIPEIPRFPISYFRLSENDSSRANSSNQRAHATSGTDSFEEIAADSRAVNPAMDG
jgi:hypothetical protein